MTASHHSFSGAIPEHYDRYLGPLIFEDYARDLAQRAAALHPQRVLEVAAGTGIATWHLRTVLAPEVSLTVTDLNPDMLAVAQRKLGAAGNVAFQPADAMALPYPDAAFDTVVCQFGVMFFPDKAAALRQVGRVLQPGGAFLFNVWDAVEHNHLMRTVAATLRALFADEPPTFFDVPYGWYHLDTIKALLEATGFTSIEMAVLPRVSPCEAAQDVARGFVAGTPFSLELARRGTVPLAAAIERVTQAVAETHGDPPVGAKMQAIVILARVP